MCKKVVILITILIFIFLVISQLITFNAVKSTLYDYNTKGKNQIVHDSIKNYDAIMCNLNIFQPKYILITSAHYQYNDIDRKSLSIGFFNISRPHIFSFNWQIEYTGGTTVKNTTFPELVKMVKEDCYQFQEDYDNPNPETGIDWGYREAEPPKAQEEIEEEKIENYYSVIRGARYQFDNFFTDFQKEKIIEFYGDLSQMTDDEVYKAAKDIDENGLDESLKQYFFDDEGNPLF